MLDSLGSAAEGATKKLTDNPIGSALDALAGGLSGGAAPAGTSGTAKFIDAPAIGENEASDPFSAHPVSDGLSGKAAAHVPLQITKPLQFLHLAYAHDDKPDLFPGTITAHGLAFRDALMREDALIYSFASAAKAVLKAGADSKGAAGKLLDTAGSLLGGSKSAAPGPESVDPILSQIRAAADAINLDSFDYPTIHKAGIDLAKAADAHNENCKKALAPGGGGGGMGLPSIPGLSSLAGGAGIPDIVGKIPEWLFKVQDAYTAMYREARKAYEWELMKISHDLSIAAIEGKWLPSYDIWRFRAEDATQAAASDGDPSLVEQKLADGQKLLQQKYANIQGKGLGPTDTGPGSDANKALADAQQSMAKVRQQGEEKASDLVGLLDTAQALQADCPKEAVAALAAAFKVFQADTQRARKGYDELMCKALGDALLGDGKPLPGPIAFVVKYASSANLAVLERVYQYLQALPTAPDARLILTATYDAIGTRLVGLVLGLFGITPAANDNTKKKDQAKSVVDDVGKGNVGDAFTGAKDLVPSKDEGANKAADLVMAFLKTQGHHLDGILMFIASELHKELFDAYMEAEAKNAMTMEVYLGRLPMLSAMLQRDLIFPVFNLLMKAFGLADKLAGAVWDPVSSGIGKAADVATSVKDKKDEVAKAGKDAHDAAKRVDSAIDQKKQDLGKDASDLGNMDSSASSLDDLQRIKDAKEAQANKLKDEAAKTPDDLMKAVKGDGSDGDPSVPKKADGSGPISAPRKVKGTAQKVTGAQIDSAGRETPGSEADLLAARNAPPPPAPPAKDTNPLTAIGNMF